MLIEFEKLKHYFKNEKVEGVIHIGAHGAEELEKYISNDISSIIWVEANYTLAGNLLNRTFPHLGSSVHFFAAHEIDGATVELNLSNNGESSSILQLGTHKTQHPHIHYVGKLSVPAWTIDTFMENKGFDKQKFNFANIDVQGAELLVLRGMKKQLNHLKYLYLEVNKDLLYENCALIQEIDEYLKDFGFTRTLTEMTEYGWGDAFYVKEN